VPGSALLLVAALPLLGGPLPATSPRGPRIALEPTQIQLGRVLQGKTLSRRFLIRNLGDQELLVQTITSSCDCTVALADGTRVAPGQSAAVRFTLRTGSASGRIVRTLLVKSNDASQPTAELVLEATVTPVRPGAGESP
jgi:hypothetical protein